MMTKLASLQQPLREAWRKLGPRERRLAIAIAAVLSFVLIYTAVFIPMQRSIEKLRTAQPAEQAQLAAMRAQATLVERARESGTAQQPANLASFAADTAARFGLTGAMTKAEPEGAGAVRIQLDGAPYRELLAWLAEMQKTAAVRVDTASIEAHASPGAVSARLLLRAPGP